MWTWDANHLTYVQGGKKPGSAGAGLPQSEDMPHELSSWLQKIL